MNDEIALFLSGHLIGYWCWLNHVSYRYMTAKRSLTFHLLMLVGWYVNAFMVVIHDMRRRLH